jgi:hypothetical protein
MAFIGSVMRARLVLLVGVLWAGEAQPSSIVTPPPMQADTSRSVFVLSSPMPQSAEPDVVAGTVDDPGYSSANTGFLVVSPSVVSMGEVAGENVAAIGGKGSHTGPDSLPLVIRGGLTGDAFSSAPADTVTMTSGFDANDGAKAPEAPKPADPAEAAMPSVAPEPAAPAHAPGLYVGPE